MTQYIVHLYREMRIDFGGIEAETPEAAAEIASGKPTGDADAIEDCDGENLTALVDVAGDEDFHQSVTIEFETERQRKAAPKLLSALKSILTYAENEAYALEKLKDSPEAEAEADRAWNAVESAQAVIAEAEVVGVSPSPPLAGNTPTRFEYTHRPEENPDRSFVLVDGKFDVAIIRTDEGVVVDIYPKDGLDSVATTYAFDSDTEDQPGDATAPEGAEEV
jgi:hypothetical protein